MNRRSILAAGVGLAIATPTAAQTRPRIEAFDPAFWRLIDRNADTRVIATGGDLGVVPAGADDYGASLESPIWHPNSFLLFSNIPQNKILKWTPSNGVEVFLDNTGHANGLWFDQQNRLLMAEHSGRQVSRVEANGSRTVIMRSYRNQRLNRPNTVITRSDGGIYFTDFGFRTGPTEDWDVDFEGIYYVSPDLGTRVLLTRDVVAPHKILFSRDERTLLVGQYQGILAFDMTNIASPDATENQPGGRIVRDSQRWFWRGGADRREPRVMHDLVAANGRFVDGVKMDAENNIWFSGRFGVWALSAEGRLLGRIDFGESTPNLAFGGDDLRTLFVTANHTVYAVETRVAGLPIPSRPA